MPLGLLSCMSTLFLFQKEVEKHSQTITVSISSNILVFMYLFIKNVLCEYNFNF